MLSSPEISEDIDLGSLVVRGLRHGAWSKVPDAYGVGKSAYDGYDGYNDNDGMSAVQSVYIVLAVLTGLCSLYKCMGGECPAASCDCCDCENTSHIEFDKAIEEAPHQVKILAVAACDNTNDRFDSYEGDFRGEYGLKLKLKDNGKDGYSMEGNGHTNRTTEISKYSFKAVRKNSF